MRRDTAPSVFNDQQSITADPTNAGLVYAVWDRLSSRRGIGRVSSRRSVANAFRDRLGSPGARTAASWSRAPDLRPGPERPDDRQPDRRPAQRHARDVLTEFNNENTEGSAAPRSACFARRTRGRAGRPVLVDRLETVSITDPDTGAPVRTGEIVPDSGDRAEQEAVRRLAGRALQRWPERQIAFSQSLTVGSRGRAGQGQPDADQHPSGNQQRSRRPWRLRTTARSESRTTTSATTRQFRTACPPTTSPSTAIRRRRRHARVPFNWGQRRTGSPGPPFDIRSTLPFAGSSFTATTRASRAGATSALLLSRRTAAIRRAPSSGALAILQKPGLGAPPLHLKCPSCAEPACESADHEPGFGRERNVPSRC